MNSDTTMYDQLKREIYRIGWRIQYRAKNIRRRECSFSIAEHLGQSITSQSENRILVQQLLNNLSSSVGRTILFKVYIQDLKETEVARQLNISQQAVNKWKRKMLQELLRTLNSFN